MLAKEIVETGLQIINVADYADKGYSSNSLFLYFAMIALNAAVWWMLTLPKTIRVIRGILVLNALISAFYGLFPLFYVILIFVIPHEDLKGVTSEDRELMSITAAREALFGGSSFGEVAWKVISRLVPLFLAISAIEDLTGLDFYLNVKKEGADTKPSQVTAIDATQKRDSNSVTTSERAAPPTTTRRWFPLRSKYRNGGDGSGGSGGTSALTVEEKAELKANFDAIDTDKGGTLDRYEFKAAMELAFAKHPDKPTMPSDDVLKQEFNRCDTDKNGTIDLDEFLEVFAKVKRGEDGGILGKMLGRSVSIYLDTAAAVHESNELRKSKARTKQAGGGAPTLADFRQETRGDGFVDYYLVVRNLAADQVRGVRDKGKEGEGKASTRLIGDI